MKLNKRVWFVAVATTLFVFGAISVFGQDTPVLPADYATWPLALDHSSKFLYKGEEASIRDQHYVRANKEQTEGEAVVVFYKPENGELWFVIYIHEKVDLSTQEFSHEEHFFEPGAEGSWTHVGTPKDQEETDQIFKSRYNLESVQSQ